MVVAISAATAAELAELARIPVDRVRVIPISIDDGYVPVPPDDPAGPPVVLAVGTTANKNVERLVDTVRGLEVQLHVVGQLSAAQRAQLEASGVSWRNDGALSAAQMRRAYAECDVVAYASIYEGFGMPIIEANAVGRPVVTSPRAPMDWVAGEAACLVDPEDVASIRGGLVRVLEDGDYRAELVARGYENRERFRPADRDHVCGALPGGGGSGRRQEDAEVTFLVKRDLRRAAALGWMTPLLAALSMLLIA